MPPETLYVVLALAAVVIVVRAVVRGWLRRRAARERRRGLELALAVQRAKLEAKRDAEAPGPGAADPAEEA